MFREIDRTILAKILSTTPSEISDAIMDLCQSIAPGQTPVFIPHAPAPSATMRECFQNVVTHMESHGGELLFGWAIWEWRGVFIEAEHHGVWASPAGLVDITPHECPTAGILFLPDPASPYDFEHFTRRDNVRRAISDWPCVTQWLNAKRELAVRLESYSVNKEYRMSRRELGQFQADEQHVEHLKSLIYLQMARDMTPNSRCFCRSGLKFKKCCNRYFR